jgi:hypothetical protein
MQKGRAQEIDPKVILNTPPSRFTDLDVVQRIEAFYKMGRLDWRLREYQVPDYRDFRVWNAMRQLPGYQAVVEAQGALFDNLWVDECGRRYGKTVQWLVRDVEEAIRRPGCRGLIACAFQKNIGEIIVPLTKVLFENAPDGYFPEYHSTKGAEHECLVIPATGSIIKLVGIDKHPDATRGQFLDFAHVSEGAFVKGLEELVTATIMPQFIGRPWAWIAIESSTAKMPDCDFNRVFRVDAQARGAYRKHTIGENTTLTEEEIAKEERRCGGKGSPVARRELWCEETRDPDDMVVPEFDETYHVVDPADWPMPKYALAYVGIDPGTTDPLGLIFAYTNWERGTLVIQADWMKPNASTGEVAGVIRATELDLWGSDHKEPGEKGRDVRLVAPATTGAGKVWVPPEGSLTYWDVGSRTLRPNPYIRTSDIANRFILDLNTDHGLDVQKADKGPGSADADIQNLRMLFQYKNKNGWPRIAILKNGRTENIIAQLRSGMWNTDDNNHRTDFVRTKALGHLDCLAALKYLAREARPNRNPNRPDVVDMHNSEVHIPDRLREKLRAPETAPAFRERGKSPKPVAASRGFGR